MESIPKDLRMPVYRFAMVCMEGLTPTEQAEQVHRANLLAHLLVAATAGVACCLQTIVDQPPPEASPLALFLSFLAFHRHRRCPNRPPISCL